MTDPEVAAPPQEPEKLRQLVLDVTRCKSGTDMQRAIAMVAEKRGPLPGTAILKMSPESFRQYQAARAKRARKAAR